MKLTKHTKARTTARTKRASRKKLEVSFGDRDALVSSTLRRRDALIKHRTKCRRMMFECPRCALLNLHERMADLKFAVQHARSAKVPVEVVLREMFGIIAGGV